MSIRRFLRICAMPSACIFPAAILLCVLWFGGCGEREPIRVGFVGCMTGRLSDLGVAGRNGVILAMEEQEAAGGIHGRHLMLLTRDDEQDPGVALKVDQDLIDQGVVAVIGHMTSAMTIAALPLMNRAGVLIISPTTTTNQLNGLDDGLIRIMPPNRAETDHLSRLAFDRLGLRSMGAVYDLSNQGYSADYAENFKQAFEGLGGRLDHAIQFTSRPGLDFADMAVRLIRPDLDGILIVAGAMDTAMICQHIRMQGVNLPVISSGWAMTEDLIHYGGKAVDGVVFSHLLDLKSRENRYVGFKKQYRDRFGTDPSFAAVHGYEAARMLFGGLEKTLNPSELKQAILEQDRFFGVQGDFRLDSYGDAQRKRFLTILRQGEYEAME